MNGSSRKRKRLFFISAHFPPCAASGVFRSLGFVNALDRAEWEVTVLALKEVAEERKDSQLQERIPDSVRVIKTGYFDVFTIKRLFSRKKGKRSVGDGIRKKGDSVSATTDKRLQSGFWEEFSYLLKTPDSYATWILSGMLRAVVSSGRPDVILATAPPFSALLLGVILKSLWRKPLVVDLRDPWCQNPFRPERPPFAGAWDCQLERLVISHADQVIMNTAEACSLYQEKYQNMAQKITAINNGFDSRYPEIQPAGQVVGVDLSVVHVGSFYGNRNPSQLIEGFSGLQGVHLDLYGPGVECLRKDIVISNIKLGPVVEHETAIKLQKDADVVLVLGNCTPGSVQIPAKIFEALAVGKVLWLVDEPDSPVRNMLNEAGVRHVYSRNIADEIRASVSMLLQQKRRGDLPLLDQDKIELFSRKNQVIKLNHLLSDAAGDGCSHCR